MSLRLARQSDASSIAALSIEVWLGTYLRRGINPFFNDYVLSEFTREKTKATSTMSMHSAFVISTFILL